MKQYLKLELLVELPDDLEIELIKPTAVQVDNNITVDSDKKMTMSVDELAEELQISNTTIYTMVCQNEIPHKKVRGRILFHRQTIENWLVEGN
ncbi:helix-turn-helix domain-containing protein [Lysinibacillus sphaericus]|nr:helix-turn-helix domain-containing protein [Lysinibacillus sp. SDF0037]